MVKDKLNIGGGEGYGKRYLTYLFEIKKKFINFSGFFLLKETLKYHSFIQQY